MREFFSGWKRKMGVVTLVLAWVFMAGWARSWNLDDVIQLTSEEDMGTWIILGSYKGVLSLQIETMVPPRQIKWGIPMWLTVDHHDVTPPGDPMIWRFRCCGFASGYELRTAGALNERVDLWIAPYWSVAIPLTILSAYLLLSKPRQPRQSDDVTAVSESSSTRPGDLTRA